MSDSNFDTGNNDPVVERLMGLARQDLGSSEEVDRLARRVGVGVVSAAALGTGSGLAAAEGGAAASAGAGALVKGAALAVVVLVGAGAAALAWWPKSDASRGTGGPAVPVVSAAGPASAAPLSSAAEAADEPELTEAPEAEHAPRSASGTLAATPDRDRALPLRDARLLLRARQALLDDPARALRLTERHRAEFPQSPLQQERRVIRIEALARLNQTERARKEAEAFERDHPGSVHRPRLDSLSTGGRARDSESRE